MAKQDQLQETLERLRSEAPEEYARLNKRVNDAVNSELDRLTSNAKRTGKQITSHSGKLYDKASAKVSEGAETLERGSANVRKKVEAEANRLGSNAKRTGEQFTSHASKLYDGATRAVETTANEYGRKTKQAAEPIKKEAARLSDNAKRTGKQFTSHAGKLYDKAASKVAVGANTLEKGSTNVRNRLEAEADRLGKNAKRTGKQFTSHASKLYDDATHAVEATADEYGRKAKKAAEPVKKEARRLASNAKRTGEQFTSHAGELYDSAASKVREGADTLERGSANVRNRIEAEADRLGNNARRTGEQFASHAGKLYDDASGKAKGAIDEVGRYASRLSDTAKEGVLRNLERPQPQTTNNAEPPSELYADYKVKDPNAKADGMRWNVQEPKAKQGAPDSEAFHKMLQKTPSGEVVETPFNRQPMSDEDRQALIDSIDFRQIYKEAMENDPAAIKVLNSLSYALGGDSDLEISGQGVFTTGPDGSKQLVNIDDYLESANKVLGASLSLASFVPGDTDKPESNTGAESQRSAQAAKPSASSQSAGVRHAIPAQIGRHHFDELSPEEQRLLHEQYVVNAALKGDPTSLNKLLDGPYGRAETEANIGYKEAASDYYRAKANEKAEPKPRNVKHQYNDFGCELVIDKDTEEQLYAKDPDGGLMPAKYYNNPNAWLEIRNQVTDRLGLQPGDKADWHPAKGFFVRTADGNIVTLDAYAPSKPEKQPKPRAAIDSSLGTAKLYGFGNATD